MTMFREKGFEYHELLKEKVRNIIEIDGKSILEFVLANNKNGMISLSLIPYIALYCRSAQEFLGEKFISDEVDKSITDIRNGLKIFTEKYSKIKNKVLTSDNQQDMDFRNRLRFSIMRNWNIHNNLGIYFDDEGNVIGNTQNMDYFISIPSTKINDKNLHAQEVGMMLGSKIGLILNNVCKENEKIVIQQEIEYPNFGYMDINTNRDNFFFKKTDNKELNLIILHVLSTIGFAEHVLYKLRPDNQWTLRIEYIVAHYGWSCLKKIKNHYENNEGFNFANDVGDLLDEGTKLFPSEFRNCMMHYDLFDNERGVLIVPKYFDERIMFYGLVESLFDGKSSADFFMELRMYLNKMEKYLMSWFNLDKKKIKWDL